VLCGGERFRRHLAQSTVAVAAQRTTSAHYGAYRADRLTISVHPTERLAVVDRCAEKMTTPSTSPSAGSRDRSLARFCSRAAAVIEVVIREGSVSGHPHMFMSCVLYAVVDEVLV
jgi:hypothetical protein